MFAIIIDHVIASDFSDNTVKTKFADVAEHWFNFGWSDKQFLQ